MSALDIYGYRIPLRGMWHARGCSPRLPEHGFCVQCAFLCEYIPDPGEMLAVLKALDADRKDEVA